MNTQNYIQKDGANSFAPSFCITEIKVLILFCPELRKAQLFFDYNNADYKYE